MASGSGSLDVKAPLVLAEIAAERERQDEKWGEQNHPDGTGPNFFPLRAHRSWHTASRLAAEAKKVTDAAARDQTTTWRVILLEEVFEAFAEADPAKLRAELIQVAAVAAQWVEAIDRRVVAER